MADSDSHSPNLDSSTMKDFPEELIIWLDKAHNESDNSLLSIYSDFFTRDPISGQFEERLSTKHINNCILVKKMITVQFANVVFAFQVFNDTEECFQAIQQLIKKKIKKRIFLMTSIIKGRIAIPGLIVNFPAIFVDNYWIYVFLNSTNNSATSENTLPITHPVQQTYDKNVLLFHSPREAFHRMLKDIGAYFFEKAEDFASDTEFENAVQYFQSAKNIYEKCETMYDEWLTQEITAINDRLHAIEVQQHSRTDEDEERVGELPS